MVGQGYRHGWTSIIADGNTIMLNLLTAILHCHRQCSSITSDEGICQSSRAKGCIDCTKCCRIPPARCWDECRCLFKGQMQSKSLFFFNLPKDSVVLWKHGKAFYTSDATCRLLTALIEQRAAWVVHLNRCACNSLTDQVGLMTNLWKALWWSIFEATRTTIAAMRHISCPLMMITIVPIK